MRMHALSSLLLTLLLAACAGPRPDSDAVPRAVDTPVQQFMCVSRVRLSEASQAHTIAVGEDAAPIGEWLAQAVGERFWVDAMLRASGKPQPQIATGFATGTGVRPAGLGQVEAQVVLQFQIMRPTGQSYDDIIGGRATARSVDEAARAALHQALGRLETALVNAGVCRRMD